MINLGVVNIYNFVTYAPHGCFESDSIDGKNVKTVHVKHARGPCETCAEIHVNRVQRTCETCDACETRRVPCETCGHFFNSFEVYFIDFIDQTKFAN